MGARMNIPTHKIFNAITLIVFLFLVAITPAPVNAATIIVTATADTVATDTFCTLREAINNLNAGADTTGGDCIAGDGINDTINVPAGTYTITGAAGDDANLSGDFDIAKAVTITGAGQTLTFIDGGAIDQVFDVTIIVPVTFDGVTIQNGNNPNLGPYPYFAGGITALGAVTVTNSTITSNMGVGGGGIVGRSAVTLTNSSVSGNTAGQFFGGIYADSTVSLNNSTVSGNAATAGGGIFAGAVTLTNSTVNGNTATWDYGGICCGTITLTNSTVSGNTVGFIYGGIVGRIVTLTNSTVSGNYAGLANSGIYAEDAVTLTNSTVSGNTGWAANGISANGAVTLTNSSISGNTAMVGNGGGIYARGAVTLTNSTIYGNSAGAGRGGVYGSNSWGTFSLTIDNSIIANNAGGDCGSNGGTWTSTGYNIDSDGTCLALSTGPGDFTSAGFTLPALASNGGSTMTHALLPGSPAIDAGSCVTATDQRGIVRPQGIACDIGAYEATGNVYGCTDPAATNHNPVATVNDGSCTYPPWKPRNHWPHDPNGGGPDWLIYPGADETNVNPGTAFKWFELADDDGDEITYDPQFCDGFESGECTSWSSVNGRVATLRQAQGDNHLSLRGAEGDVAISGLPRFARNDSLSKTTAGGAATTTGALLFALGFIGAIRTRRGRAFMLALLLMTSGAVMTACGPDSSDDDSSSASAAITCDSVEDGVVCRTQTGLAANTEYTWRVVASDGKGGENISVIRSFTTGE